MKRIVVVVVFGIVGSWINAQNFHFKLKEAYLGVGANSYFGDVGGELSGGSTDYKSLNTFDKGISFTGGVLFNTIDELDVRFALSYLKIQGEDKGSKFEDRGYSFKSSIINFDVIGQYTFFSYGINKKRNVRFSRRRGLVRRHIDINMYALAGLGFGICNSIPDKNMEVRKDDLRENNNILSLPLGVGGQVSVNEYVSIGVEVGGRVCFSDYVDGFSPMPSEANDMFYFTNIYVVYNLASQKSRKYRF